MAHEEYPITLESLDPALQADVDQARILADEANTAFNLRRTYAGELAAYHASEVQSVDAVARLLTAVDDSDRGFRTYKTAAEALMPPVTAFETSKPTEPIEPSASEKVWVSMSHEQRIKATELRTAIAEGPLKKYGVTEESLRVVSTEADGQKKFTLILTGQGLDIGDHRKDFDNKRSYNSVMSSKNDKLFQVEVGGVTYDTRTGMTDEVYEAKIEEARARGVILPDSQQLSQETGDDWTWTMLTGEPLTADGIVQIRRVYEGRVYRLIGGPDNAYRFLRVCPAVEIK